MNDNNGPTSLTGTWLYTSHGTPAAALADAARSTQDPAIDHELDTKLTCALGGPATDEDKAKVERSAELLEVIKQVRELHSAISFTTVARTRVDLANEGAFGKPTRPTWNARTQVERTLATQHVYEVLFAALAAGFHIVPPERPGKVWRCLFCDTNNELDRDQCRTCEHARGERPAGNTVAAALQALQVPDKGATP